MGVNEGETAAGIFGRSSRWYGQGRNFRRKKHGALERFADLLAEHTDQADLDAGRNLATGKPLAEGAELDPGGNVRLCAQRLGVKPAAGNAMLQRMRQRLGPQAC